MLRLVVTRALGADFGFRHLYEDFLVNLNNRYILDGQSWARLPGDAFRSWRGAVIQCFGAGASVLLHVQPLLAGVSSSPVLPKAGFFQKPVSETGFSGFTGGEWVGRGLVFSGRFFHWFWRACCSAVSGACFPFRFFWLPPAFLVAGNMSQ